MSDYNILEEMAAEGAGTFILVLFGVGSVGLSVWTGAYGLWPVSLMFALGVALGVYASGKVTGGHLNPAVTITMAVFAGFPWKKVVPFIVAQMIGAFVAAAIIHLFYNDIIAAFEAAHNIVRGEMGSQLSAMGYGTYAPNPAFIGTDAVAFAKVSNLKWFASEAFVTAVLLFGIFYLTDEDNSLAPQANLVPVFIGLLVAALVAYEAPISMTAMNPARDLGPRLVSFFAGWGDMAFPGPRGGWWIPAASTIVGGLIGGAIYHGGYKKIFRPRPVKA
jgi:glycerol uptake facilitator protein